MRKMRQNRTITRYADIEARPELFAVSVNIGGNADVADYCRKQRSRPEVDMRQPQAKCFNS